MNRGGRPRLKTLSEKRQQASLEAQNKNNGGKTLSIGGFHSNNLKEQKEMMRLRNLQGELGLGHY